jgi:hypothetical protein
MGLSLKTKFKQPRSKQQVVIQSSATIQLTCSAKFSGDINFIFNEVSSVNETAINIIASEIGDYLDRAMGSGIWGGSDTDIVDSGELRNSLTIEKSSSGITISYDAPYAKLIHYGGYIVPYGDDSRSRVYIPGKPWAESIIFGDGPIAGYNYQDAYNRAIKAVI